jgi:hypothetical protein
MEEKKEKVHQELHVLVIFAFCGESTLFFLKWFYLRVAG